MTEPDTLPVSFAVLGIEPVHGSGRLIALAIVELDIGGVIVMLSGVAVHRRTDGRKEVKAPLWRHPGTGKWLPGIILPPALAEALAAEVVDCLDAYPNGFAAPPQEQP